MRIVGIDAGGTKTELLLCDEKENIINRVLLGTGNPNDIGIGACLELLGNGLDKLLGNDLPDAVFAGVSGGGFGEHREKIKAFLSKRYPFARVDNGTDAINLLYCANTDKTCGALICGTGSALFVKRGEEILRFGGWGHFFDLGGSAYDVGRDAIRALLEAEETAQEKLTTPLCKLLLARLGRSAHEAIGDFYDKGKVYIASFAPTVFEAFDMGDKTAHMIVEENAQAVADRISLAALAFERIEQIVCAGGLFSASAFYSELSKRVDIPLIIPDISPAMGACRKALSMI